jgi:splicing factor U2AF subunit
VGNIPLDIKGDALSDILNQNLIKMGKESGVFQSGNPVVGAWISGDGHYAFVDFRTADEATQGFVLQQVQIKGNYLKVGRPKNATGIIPTPQQLLCGDPHFNPNNPGASKGQKQSTSATLVQQALLQSRMLQSKKLAEIKFNQRLMISNFPDSNTKENITELCNCFGKVKGVELIMDKKTNRFGGSVHVDFESEQEAK